MTDKSEQNFQQLYDNITSNQTKEHVKKLVRRKKDGKIYKSRQQIIEEYNKSMLPFPLSNLFKLDYCRNIFFNHLYNSFFFAAPLTLLSAYFKSKNVNRFGYKKFSISYMISHYILVTFAVFSFLTLDILFFCDYCNPKSEIYRINNDSEYFKDVLKSRMNTQKTKFEVKMNRTKDIGLTDEEL